MDWRLQSSGLSSPSAGAMSSAGAYRGQAGKGGMSAGQEFTAALLAK